MNPQWFGDSFDIVKRFFIEVLRDAEFDISIDGRFTGEWNGKESEFSKFISPDSERNRGKSRLALFIDPDTGIGQATSPAHTTLDQIVDKLSDFDVVFLFDQSFSRGHPAQEQMRRKLIKLRDSGSHGFYYDSHARFLFAARTAEFANICLDAIMAIGLPKNRIFSVMDA